MSCGGGQQPGTIGKRVRFGLGAEKVMPHETPIPISVMQKSLAIAMHYLLKTGQAYPLSQIRHFCAEVMYREWNAGRRHPVWLANKAIGALERAREAYWFHILYEPVTASAEADAGFA
jgi:hypothetical protein